MTLLRTVCTFAASALLVAGTSAAARAQVTLGPGIGFNADAEEIYLNGHLTLDLGSASNLMGRVELEIYPFISNTTLLVGGFSVLYPFTLPDSPLQPYAGGGAAIRYASFDTGALGSVSDTDLKLAAVGGIKGDTPSNFTWFGDLTVRFLSGSEVLLRFGIGIPIGGP